MAVLEELPAASINDKELATRPVPSLGDIVTFTWVSGASRTRGIILRVRKDLDWLEVAHKIAQQVNGIGFLLLSCIVCVCVFV
jgi:hypothetical protein